MQRYLDDHSLAVLSTGSLNIKNSKRWLWGYTSATELILRPVKVHNGYLSRIFSSGSLNCKICTRNQSAVVIAL